MPRDQLLGLVADVDRLLAAGATAAVGNDGLSRRGRTLRELGQKIAALQPVADAVERVTAAGTREVGRAFLDLLVVARQLRGSLAGTGLASELQAIEESGPWQTPMPARDVYNIHDSLTADASSSALHDAVEREVTGDLRLLPSALAALESNKSSIADFVAERVLPHFGLPILAELRSAYDPSGGAEQGRRLLAITRIDAREGRKLALEGMKQGNPTVRLAALRALSVVDPQEAHRAAIDILAGKANPRLKLCAVETLERIKAKDAEAASLLVQALVGKDFHVSHKAQSVLGSIGRAAVPPLIELLRGPEAEARRKTIWVLNAIGPDAAEAVPFLVAALEDSTPLNGVSISQCAVAALAKIGPTARAAVAPLMRFLESSDFSTRFGAAKALLKITGDARRYLPVLIEALSSRDIQIRRDAALALEEIGPPAKAAIPALIAALKDRKGNIRHFAATALGRIGHKAEEVVPLLIPMVTESEWYIRQHAIRALGLFGPKARASLPVIREAAKDRSQYIQEVVGLALSAIEGCSPAD